MGRRGAEIPTVNVNDLTESEDGDGDNELLRLRLGLSKTNSSGMKEEHVDVQRSADLRYCPVHAVRRYQPALIGRGDLDGPLSCAWTASAISARQPAVRLHPSAMDSGGAGDQNIRDEHGLGFR
jgi:hypothetical protein